jgi:peptide deformylase
MKKIVQKGNKTLRLTAKDVLVDQITSSKIQEILSDMQSSLSGEKDGVALAAPQIDVSLRIFIVSPIAYEGLQKKIPEKDRNFIFINPKIIKQSTDKKLMEEGCLSVRPWYGKVRRSSRVTVEAYNGDGEKFQMEGSGLIAQIFQHEIDHLDGILFVDKAKDLIEINMEEINNQ